MKWFVPAPEAMSNELKETLIREHPDGLRVVLAEEHPQDGPSVAELIGVDSEDLATLLAAEPAATDLLQ